MIRRGIPASLIAIAISASSSWSFIPLQPPAPPPGFVYASGDRLMVDGETFVMKGFNYYPRDYGWTSMADWDWSEVDQEFVLAEALGANTIRTGINYLYSTGNPASTRNIYTHNEITPESLGALESLLSLADRHGMKVVLWLNDGMPWELYAPAHFDVVQEYLEGLIPVFADDARIAAWDLATDLDGTMLLPPPTGGYGALPWMTRDGMVTFLRIMSQAVRALDANHLVTVGHCWPSSSLLTEDITDFFLFQFLGADDPQVLSDQRATAGLEDYGRWYEALGNREAVVERVEAKLRGIQARMTRPQPIVLGEYGIYSGGESSEALQQAVYEVVLEAALLRLHLAGALNWALTDFIWPPEAFTMVPDDAPQAGPAEQSFGVYRLDYSPKPAAEVAAAYYADRPTVRLVTQPEKLTFEFSDAFVPGPEDPRSLAAAFDSIRYLDAGQHVLAKLDMGNREARPFLASGFYEDEGPWGEQAADFVWAGADGETATIQMAFPDGTQSMQIRLLAGVEEMDIKVLVDGEVLTTLHPGRDWSVETVALPPVRDLKVGDVITVRGRLNLPLSTGTVVVQTSTDGVSWTERGSAPPERGAFRIDLALADAGETRVRAVWSGEEAFLPAESEAIEILVENLSTPTPLPTPTQPPVATQVEPVEKGAPRPATWLPPLLAVLGVLGLGGGILMFARRRR